MGNGTREIFEELFERNLQLLTNPACKVCDAQIKHPLLPWIVGSSFSSNDERVLFVGKPHRGTPGNMLPSGVIDPTEMVKDDLWGIGWPYWSYTREIAENLYGQDAFDNIAFSNVIKCTNVGADDGKSRSTDLTSIKMAQNCIQGIGVIWEEVKLLKPFVIVFYTYNLFPEMLEAIPVALGDSVKEITARNHSVPCRNKQLGWWERSCETSWCEKLRILVIGHPERMGRKEYVELVTNWIRPEKR